MPEHGRWAELSSWGPSGVEDGPSPLAGHGRIPFRTPADAAPAEYLPSGLRPFGGADLDVRRPGGEPGSWWSFTGERTAGERTAGDGELRLVFADEQLGLEAVLCYQVVPGTDVLRRWIELANTGDGDLLLRRLDSAAVNVPVPGGARLTYLVGQWAQEFQLKQVEIDRGGFAIGSSQGVSGHDYAPWLAVQDAACADGPTTSTWGVSLAWSGSWHIDAQVDEGGLLRLRAGREPHEGEVLLPAGGTLTTPYLVLAFSPEGLDGLARVWHAHERLEASAAQPAAPAGALQLLGGHRFRRRAGRTARARPRRRLDRRGTVRRGRRLVHRPPRRHRPASATGPRTPRRSRTASTPSSTRSAVSAWTSGSGSSRRRSAPAPACSPSTLTGSTRSTAARPR